MAMEQIKSFQNSYVKKIRSLKYKKYRQREKLLFWAEDDRNVFEAIGNRWEIDSLVYSPELLRSDHARNLLKETAIRSIPVSKAVFERIAIGELPQGIGAVIKLQSEHTFENILPKKWILYRFRKPTRSGNVGAVIRSAVVLLEQLA